MIQKSQCSECYKEFSYDDGDTIREQVTILTEKIKQLTSTFPGRIGDSYTDKKTEKLIKEIEDKIIEVKKNGSYATIKGPKRCPDCQKKEQELRRNHR